MIPVWMPQRPVLDPFPVETPATVNLVFTGDSQTANDDWPGQFRKMLRGTPTWHNVAVGGKTLAQLRSDDLTRVDSLIVPGAINIVFCWAGTNDLSQGATTDTQLLAAATAYVSERKAAGAQAVLLGTILDRNNASYPASYNTYRAAYNTALRTNYGGTGAAGNIDVALNSIIGVDGAYSNTTFFGDGVHLTTTGQAITAGFAYREYARIMTALEAA